MLGLRVLRVALMAAMRGMDVIRMAVGMVVTGVAAAA
jgi:hypothetical protein